MTSLIRTFRTSLTVAAFVLTASGMLRAADGSLAPPWAKQALSRVTNPILGLPPIVFPEENPPTTEKIALGRKIFFDRRLSLNRTMSCAMCHIPEQGFTNWELQTPVGFEGRSIRRNAPTIVNVAFYTSLFTDGRETVLETQWLSPAVAGNEMANPSIGYVIALIQSLDDYDGRFEATFGGPPTADRIGMALASYQRTITAGNSRFDRWRYGDEPDALSPSEARGFALFDGKAGCTGCHLIGNDHALFTDNAYHDIGHGWWREQLRQNPPETEMVEVAPGVSYPTPRATIDAVSEKKAPDLGRYEVTQTPTDSWKYRTPSLRNVAITAPYMHDGGMASLRDVLTFYNGGGRPHEGQDEAIEPLGLSPQDIDDLEDFLRSLTSPDIAQLVREARTAAPDNW